ncbi:ABC transporter permease [Leucobacter allii]|uniref:ABC transporter permease n=1 Tax=Leucobacter allii TaxID=2932247 RepID=A0ABY4FI62_9MICO|nr:ABC transporter permease [Leucobacter allii]UOQ56365.1 ABC transporter permease [Leucobacter allii]
MRALDIIGTAMTNTLRSKTRTLLTVLAIFVGAFTLTLTSGLGTGINRYIDDTVAGIGASDVMTVTKDSGAQTDGGFGSSDGPVEYDPDAVPAGQGQAAPGMSSTTTALTPEDLDELARVPGVLRVEPTRSITVDYAQHSDGVRYTVSVGSLVPGQTVQLAAGEVPDDSEDLEVVIPIDYVDAFGFASVEDALGQDLTIALSDGVRTQHTVTATVTGVAEEALAGAGSSLIPNDALTEELWDLQNTGVPEDQQYRYASASAWYDPDASEEDVEALKSALDEAGFTGTTVADQLGAFRTVIDAIVLVLNAFAAIALLAASFGIVNTLYMSVQERTRDIGLMKAMGLGSGRVFALFSLEAVFIGLLGSLIGAGAAIAIGTAISEALSTSLFSDLPGLTVIAFDPLTVGGMAIVVMGIAFLAGTLPAARAARKDPVVALRYE